MLYASCHGAEAARYGLYERPEASDCSCSRTSPRTAASTPRTSISTSVLPLTAAESYHARLIIGLVYAPRADGDAGSALGERARCRGRGRTAMLQIWSPFLLSGTKLDVISRNLPDRVGVRVPVLTRS